MVARPRRLLFSFVGGAGHFLPLVPIARAATVAGHTVAFTVSESSVAMVRAARFEALPLAAGPPSAPASEPASGPPDRRPLLPIDPAREERDLRELFVRDAARRRAAGVLQQIAAWRPDAVVCDEVDFGSMIAAERASIPYATVVVLAAGGMIRPDVVADALDEIRAEHGLPPDPNLLALERHLVLVPGPPSLRDPRFPLPPGAHGVRNDAPDPDAVVAGPPWSVVRPGGSAIYVTLGTIFNLESGDLLDRILLGLADHPGDVLVTVGAEIDPSELGPQPAHIHIERFVPQAAVLPHVDVVISHAGSGSVLGTLAHGVPMILLAMGADQPWNAARCVALGAAIALDPLAVTPSHVRSAVQALAVDPSYRVSARRLQAEMATLPPPAQAVERIVALVRP